MVAASLSAAGSGAVGSGMMVFLATTGAALAAVATVASCGGGSGLVMEATAAGILVGGGGSATVGSWWLPEDTVAELMSSLDRHPKAFATLSVVAVATPPLRLRLLSKATQDSKKKKKSSWNE